jgi:hypothetical protein
MRCVRSQGKKEAPPAEEKKEKESVMHGKSMSKAVKVRDKRCRLSVAEVPGCCACGIQSAAERGWRDETDTHTHGALTAL